jgi:hypothetical protein
VLPRFEIVARRRPVRLVVPGTALPAVAPCVAVQAELIGTRRAELALTSGGDSVTATYDGTVTLHVTTGSTTTEHRSRRYGRPAGEVAAVALALTGPQVTAFTRERGRWVARARYDLTDRLDTHDETWLGALQATSTGPVDHVETGTFGQLGLRDLRVVSNADGSPFEHSDGILLTASSSGPGFFPTGHTSVWTLDPETFELEHLSDLFFRRPDRPGVFGDHASHLLRHRDRWLVATSTWGDFVTPGRRQPRSSAALRPGPQSKDFELPSRKRPGTGVRVTVAETRADLLSGQHVLDTRALDLPTSGPRSVGVWDPHLVRSDGEWLVAYVSAPRFFRFHPALARGANLDTLQLHAADLERRATEGPTLVHLDDGWRLLASDGRAGRRGQRAAFPVFDLDLQQLGRIDATYPTNLPWPTVVRHGDDWLMVGFNGASYGGPLVGYGSHGQVVVQRGGFDAPTARTGR